MQRYELILQSIRERWGKHLAASLCEKIIDFVVSAPESQTRHLTYVHISKIAHIDPTNENLHAAIAILSSRFHVLKLGMIFYPTSGDEHYLDDEELKVFFRHGEFVDPDTGHPVQNADAFLIPYYSASKCDLLAEAKDGSSI